MARGSGRTIPSILGGGLERGTRAILEATMERAEREQRRDLAERQLGIAERTQALNQLTTLVDFMEPGTTLGEAGPLAQRVFSRALDIDTEGLEDLELNRETFQTALDAKRLEFLESEEFDENLLVPSTRAGLGLEPSEDVARARDEEAQMRFNALAQIQQDSNLMSEHVERVLGRDPINLRIPGVGGQPDRVIPFNTTAAAEIYAQFALARENFSFELALEEQDRLVPLVEEVQEAVSEAGSSVSRTALQRVFSVYQEAAQSGGSAPISEFLANPRVTEGEKLALRFLTGSIQVGESAFLSSVDPRLGTFYRILTAVGSELEPDQTAQLMMSITEALSSQIGADLFDPGLREAFPGGRSPFGGLTLEFLPMEDIGLDVGEAPSSEGATREPGEPPLIPQEAVTDEDIQAAFEAGDPPLALADLVGEERVRRVLGEEALMGELEPDVEEAAQIPEGGMNPDAVPIPFRQDVQQLNRLIRTLERTRGQLARQNLERAIERIRERIRSGVSGG